MFKAVFAPPPPGEALKITTCLSDKNPRLFRDNQSNIFLKKALIFPLCSLTDIIILSDSVNLAFKSFTDCGIPSDFSKSSL